MHDPVTWYGIYSVGLSKQKISGWTGTSSFVLKVPLCNLRTSIINSVPRDGPCDRIVQIWMLSPGQTDWQVFANGRKLNLGRNLCWVTKRTRKFPRKCTQVANKIISKQTILYFVG